MTPPCRRLRRGWWLRKSAHVRRTVPHRTGPRIPATAEQRPVCAGIRPEHAHRVQVSAPRGCRRGVRPSEAGASSGEDSEAAPLLCVRQRDTSGRSRWFRSGPGVQRPVRSSRSRRRTSVSRFARKAVTPGSARLPGGRSKRRGVLDGASGRLCGSFGSRRRIVAHGPCAPLSMRPDRRFLPHARHRRRNRHGSMHGPPESPCNHVTNRGPGPLSVEPWPKRPGAYSPPVRPIRSGGVFAEYARSSAAIHLPKAATGIRFRPERDGSGGACIPDPPLDGRGENPETNRPGASPLDPKYEVRM